MEKRTLLVDGDIVCYRIAAANESVIEWDEDEWTVTGKEKECEAAVEECVTTLLDGFHPDQTIWAFSDKENFRKAVYPDYKSNRKNTRKPVTYRPLREFVTSRYETKTLPTLEADDVIGILATGDWIKGEKVVISNDKDFNQIPCLRSFFPEDSSQGFSIEEVREKDADLFFYRQILTGDSTDGYPGCPGIGPVKAEKVITEELEEEQIWDVILEQYSKKSLSEAYALSQARCARILRAEDYDIKKKKVKLWNPTKTLH